HGSLPPTLLFPPVQGMGPGDLFLRSPKRGAARLVRSTRRHRDGWAGVGLLVSTADRIPSLGGGGKRASRRAPWVNNQSQRSSSKTRGGSSLEAIAIRNLRWPFQKTPVRTGVPYSRWTDRSAAQSTLSTPTAARRNSALAAAPTAA